MATDPGDLVLDPTCGSGTTASVAEQWGRRWITIDTSRVALALARARIMGARYPFYLLADSRDGQVKEAEVTRNASRRPAHPRQHPPRLRLRARAAHHLKSIANNAEIDVIWEKWQQTLEPLREQLNKALKQSWQEWEIPASQRPVAKDQGSFRPQIRVGRQGRKSRSDPDASRRSTETQARYTPKPCPTVRDPWPTSRTS